MVLGYLGIPGYEEVLNLVSNIENFKLERVASFSNSKDENRIWEMEKERIISFGQKSIPELIVRTHS